METIPATGLDAWMREGGIVITASERSARALTSAFHRARRAEGLAAWPAPNVFEWRSFARAEWERRSLNATLPLNSTQEQALWSEILAASSLPATLLEGPRRRLAASAAEAHSLVCSYDPELLGPASRSGWSGDAAAFSQWLAEFDAECHSNGLLSANRIPLDLVRLLEDDRSERPALVVAAFDRLLPVHRSLLDAWGAWQTVTANAASATAHYYAAPDQGSELAACALWCKEKLAQNPEARILVLTQDAATRRGAIERAFYRNSPLGIQPQFEFTLGVPLASVAIARSVQLLLKWLDDAIAENELDWLFSSGFLTKGNEEQARLQSEMRGLRRRGLQRTQWSVGAFLGQSSSLSFLPQAWVERLAAAQERLRAAKSRKLSPADWAAFIPQLVTIAGWPGGKTLTSAEYQAAESWHQAVETCATLGYDGRRIDWKQFARELDATVRETLFAEESKDPPILIAGPAESAGLDADYVWFLGADEDAWPARGSMHALLPAPVQRKAQMPHATPQSDWELARVITNRLIATTKEICFSYARQRDDVEAHPSRMAMSAAGPAQDLPPALRKTPQPPPVTIPYQDSSRIPLLHALDETGPLNMAGPTSPARGVRGGSNVLTSQSQCPFKAFAAARLDAQGWDAAEAGLTAPVRGQLLHTVMSAIWAGPPNGISTLDGLIGIEDRRAFVAAHVRLALNGKPTMVAREMMPRRYLELEELRLTRLVTEWLDYEAARLPFSVEETEFDTTASVGGLNLKVRLDRVDRLKDGSLLVIDYKTGDVEPAAWATARPEDVQLPLYAGFAIDPEEKIGGVVFAKVRAGETCFAGRIQDAKAVMGSSLGNIRSLQRNPLTVEQLNQWKQTIEKLAYDFVEGRAGVDPREYPLTCEHCDLHSVCRIHEQAAASEENGGVEEAANE